jgi:hypothetical protein
MEELKRVEKLDLVEAEISKLKTNLQALGVSQSNGTPTRTETSPDTECLGGSGNSIAVTAPSGLVEHRLGSSRTRRRNQRRKMVRPEPVYGKEAILRLRPSGECQQPGMFTNASNNAKDGLTTSLQERVQNLETIVTCTSAVWDICCNDQSTLPIDVRSTGQASVGNPFQGAVPASVLECQCKAARFIQGWWRLPCNHNETIDLRRECAATRIIQRVWRGLGGRLRAWRRRTCTNVRTTVPGGYDMVAVHRAGDGMPFQIPKQAFFEKRELRALSMCSKQSCAETDWYADLADVWKDTGRWGLHDLLSKA